MVSLTRRCARLALAAALGMVVLGSASLPGARRVAAARGVGPLNARALAASGVGPLSPDAGTKCGSGPNLLADGSFESSPGGLFFAGSYLESSHSWLVGGNSVNVTGGPPSGWVAENGVLSVDLNGNAPGAVSQTIAVSPTQTYAVCFYLAGNIDHGPTIKKMALRWGGVVVASYTFNITGKTATNMGWVLKVHNVVGAASGTDTLELQGTSPGAFGAAVDNVSVRQTRRAAQPRHQHQQHRRAQHEGDIGADVARAVPVGPAGVAGDAPEAERGEAGAPGHIQRNGVVHQAQRVGNGVFEKGAPAAHEEGQAAGHERPGQQ